MRLLPSVLPIPLSTAAGIEFVGEGITARDISYAVAVAHVASRMEPMGDVPNGYRIPDNRLRAALGTSSRGSIDVEEARFHRLRGGAFLFDHPIPMPTLIFKNRGGHDIPLRGNLDDEMTWIVSPEVVEKFRPRDDDEPVVGLPLDLLCNARCKHTVEIVLKLLAWHTYPPADRFTVSRSDHHIAVRFPFAMLRDRFYQTSSPNPSTFVSHYLEPAAEDALEAAGINIEIKLRRVKTHRNPKGKVRDITIFMGLPMDEEQTELDEKLARIEAEQRGDRKGWRSPPKVTRPKEPVSAPAAPTNVTVLRPASPASRFGVRTPDWIKVGGATTEPVAGRDEGDIEF